MLLVVAKSSLVRYTGISTATVTESLMSNAAASCAVFCCWRQPFRRRVRGEMTVLGSHELIVRSEISFFSHAIVFLHVDSR